MAFSDPAERIASARIAGRLLRSLNCDGRLGAALALICLALLAVGLAGETARQALRYDRDALAGGEWWRLATAHLVHLGFEHAAVNVLGLALLWMLFARDYSPRAWLLILAGSAGAIDLGLWISDSTVRWYVGSSGVLHGLLAAGTAAHLLRREAEGWLLGAFLIGKLAYEQTVGALPLVPGPVIVDAHLYGALGGTLAALLCRPLAHRRADRWPLPGTGGTAPGSGGRVSQDREPL
jgi:rhomboid family GlyGly-CTERM serine protease